MNFIFIPSCTASLHERFATQILGGPFGCCFNSTPLASVLWWISQERKIRMKKGRHHKKDRSKFYNVVNYQTSSAKRLPTRVHQSRWYFLGAPHDDELRLRIIKKKLMILTRTQHWEPRRRRRRQSCRFSRSLRKISSICTRVDDPQPLVGRSLQIMISGTQVLLPIW